MTKFLVISAVLSAVVIYLSIKYRRQIVLGIKVFKALREGVRIRETPTVKAPASERLVQCIGCGSWVPSSRAFGVGGTSAFCSAECAQRSVR